MKYNSKKLIKSDISDSKFTDDKLDEATKKLNELQTLFSPILMALTALSLDQKKTLAHIDDKIFPITKP